MQLCKEIEDIIHRKELPIECKVATQGKCSKPAEQDLELHSNVIEVLTKVTPSEMKSAPPISPVVQYVKAANKPTLSQIQKVKQKSEEDPTSI